MKQYTKIFSLISFFILLPATSQAGAWFGPVTISSFNPGGNSTNGTFIALTGTTLSGTGCSQTNSAFMQPGSSTNAQLNYKEFYSALLSAKMAGVPVKIYATTPCVNGYPIITEITIP